VVINLETLMPLSLAVSIAAGSFWVSDVATRVKRNIDDVNYLRDQKERFETTLDNRLNANQRDISDIKASVSAIDAKLTILTDRLKK